MVEFVFSLPLLILLFACVFFFGHLMRNQQRLRTADRYTAWRLKHNHGAATDGSTMAYVLYGEPNEGNQRSAFTEEYNRINVVDVTGPLLNERFFWGKAENINVHQGGGPEDTLDSLVERAALQNGESGTLAEEAIGGWPHGWSVVIQAHFPSEVRAWERIQRGIGNDDATQTHSHSNSNSSSSNNSSIWRRRQVRDGVNWRRWQNSYLDPLRTLFLNEMDNAVQSIGNAQLRGNIEDLYLERW